jgi:hypothetical protein
VTEQNQQRFGADEPAPQPTTGPVPDLGFYAGPAPAGQFGGPNPSPAGPSGSSAFGQASNPFGAAPINQFRAAPAPFGSPAAFGAGSPPVAAASSGSSGSTWKIVAGVGTAVLLIVAIFGGQFAWQQFVADPVLPETLGGMPRVSGPEADLLLGGVENLADEELSAGSEVKAALYSTGAGQGYILFAVRGSGGTDGADDGLPGWTTSEVDGLECRSIAAQAPVGMGVTACAEGKWRRGVLVMAMGTSAPDPAVVAAATHEAWRAQ